VVNDCPLCLKKRRELDDLKEENRSFEQPYVGNSVRWRMGRSGPRPPRQKYPSSQTQKKKRRNPRGALPGHPGNGRKSHEAESVDRIVEVQSETEFCPECGGPLEKKGIAKRSVLDMPSGKPKKVLFRFAQGALL
jgi:transposase